jgi:hypothetical protein
VPLQISGGLAQLLPLLLPHLPLGAQRQVQHSTPQLLQTLAAETAELRWWCLPVVRYQQ